MSNDQKNQNTQTSSTALGLRRWVQFSFIGAALCLFWLLDHVIIEIWDLFDEPKAKISRLLAAVISIVCMIILYKNPKIYAWSNEVAGEVRKVVWPSRAETWSSTAIVVATSIVAALLIYVFDTAWSSLTNFIYAIPLPEGVAL